MVLNVNSEHLFTDEVPAPLAPVQLLLFPEFDDILDNGIDDEIVSNKLEQSQNFMMLSLTLCVCVCRFVSLYLNRRCRTHKNTRFAVGENNDEIT